MELWAMGAVFVLAIGVTLIGIGWHGRRIDRHPLCADCGFDLIGRPPGGPRCAECGADVSGLAIRVGHRRSQALPIYGGFALSLPALLLVASITYVNARDVDLTPHKPAWLLLHELDGTDATESIALAELTRRVSCRALSPDDVAAAAEHCLDRQRSIRVAWNPCWGSFLEAAHAAGTLSKNDWGRYALQGFEATAYCLTITPGSPLPLHVQLAQSRQTPGAGFAARVDVRDVRVDERDNAVAASPFRVRWRVTGARPSERMHVECREATIAGASVETLADGEHELRTTVLLSICEGGEFGDVVATRTLELCSPFRVQKPPQKSYPVTAASWLQR